VGGFAEEGLLEVVPGCEEVEAGFWVFFVWACPSAVARKRQAITMRTMVRILSQIKEEIGIIVA
jgi:hypothetical protein